MIYNCVVYRKKPLTNKTRHLFIHGCIQMHPPLCGGFAFFKIAQMEIALDLSEKEKEVEALRKDDEIKSKDMMTLGLDDLIMAQASVGETHIYLLEQSLAGYLGGKV